MFAVSLLLASALVFVPIASADSSLDIDVEADHEAFSFASVNGTATFVVTITNNGDVDFSSVIIEASFDDESWEPDNVTFTSSGLNSTKGMELGTLVSDALVQVTVDVVVGYGAKVDMSKSVYMSLDVKVDDNEVFEAPDTIATQQPRIKDDYNTTKKWRQ